MQFVPAGQQPSTGGSRMLACGGITLSGLRVPSVQPVDGKRHNDFNLLSLGLVREAQFLARASHDAGGGWAVTSQYTSHSCRNTGFWWPVSPAATVVSSGRNIHLLSSSHTCMGSPLPGATQYCTGDTAQGLRMKSSRFHLVSTMLFRIWYIVH